MNIIYFTIFLKQTQILPKLHLLHETLLISSYLQSLKYCKIMRPRLYLCITYEIRSFKTIVGFDFWRTNRNLKSKIFPKIFLRHRTWISRVFSDEERGKVRIFSHNRSSLCRESDISLHEGDFFNPLRRGG